jgi:hypothetical protein
LTAVVGGVLQENIVIDRKEFAVKEEFERVSRRTTLLADLGPLPEVVESSSETAWQLFQTLQATTEFPQTEDPTVTLVGAAVWARRRSSLTIDHVMKTARRYNRVCPMGTEWDRLHTLLQEATHDEPPPPIMGAELARTTSLTKRIRVRDQVEWAAERGVLHIVHAFLANLREDQWVHMD